MSKTSEINTKIKDVIDTHTEPWGVQVTAVEKNSTIIFPAQFMTTVSEAIKMLAGVSKSK